MTVDRLSSKYRQYERSNSGSAVVAGEFVQEVAVRSFKSVLVSTSPHNKIPSFLEYKSGLDLDLTAWRQSPLVLLKRLSRSNCINWEVVGNFGLMINTVSNYVSISNCL